MTVRAVVVVVGVATALLLWPGAAAAHNCGSFTDCFQTTNAATWALLGTFGSLALTFLPWGRRGGGPGWLGAWSLGLPGPSSWPDVTGAIEHFFGREVFDGDAWLDFLGTGLEGSWKISSVIPGTPAFIYTAATDPAELARRYQSTALGLWDWTSGTAQFVYAASAVSPATPGYYVELWRVDGDMERHVGVQLATGLGQAADGLESLVPGSPEFFEELNEVIQTGTIAEHDGLNNAGRIVVSIIDWETFEEDPNRWFGRIAPEIAIEVATAGGASGVSLTDNVIRGLDDVGDAAAAGTRLPPVPERTAVPGPGGAAGDVPPPPLAQRPPPPERPPPDPPSPERPGSSPPARPTPPPPERPPRPDRPPPTRPTPPEPPGPATGSSTPPGDSGRPPAPVPDRPGPSDPVDGTPPSTAAPGGEGGSGRPPSDGDPPRSGPDEPPGDSGRWTPQQQSEIAESRQWRSFDRDLDGQFFDVLDDFGGDPYPPPGYRGGEGQLFLSDDNPALTLKRWHESRLDDFGESVDALVDARRSIESDPELSRVIDVTEVHGRGPDWIIRDFDGNSFPLRDALAEADPQAQRAFDQAVDAMEGTTDPQLRTILQRLTRSNGPSANIHWSPTTGRLLVIDMM